MIEFFKHDPKAVAPTRAYMNDAGIDLYALESVTIHKGGTGIIRTGISIMVPPGYCGKIEDRSGLASSGLIIGAGVIDAMYNGELKIVMHNFNYEQNRGIFNVEPGQKIAQLVMNRIDTTGLHETKTLWTSERGSNGFGSSDNKEKK